MVNPLSAINSACTQDDDGGDAKLLQDPTPENLMVIIATAMLLIDSWRERHVFDMDLLSLDEEDEVRRVRAIINWMAT